MKAKLKWIHWRMTGYKELTQLLRSHTGNYDALTPVGLKRMEELGHKESELRRALYKIIN